MANTHAVMKSNLAKALIESGVQHYDLGGIVSAFGGGGNPVSLLSGGLSPIAGGLKGIGAELTTTNPYQGQLAPTEITPYQNVINGSQNQSMGTFQQQQNLAQTLLNQSQGVGPSPAQAMLNQATGANVANQGALMAGQRGAGANVGLQSALAAKAGSNAEQQAIGQGATLKAQEQLGAQSSLSNLYGQMGNQSNALYGLATGGQNAQNSNQVANYAQMQGINSGVAQNNATAQNTATGGLINGLMGGGAKLIGAGAAEGGEVEADGNIVSPKGPAPILPLANGGGVPGTPPHPGNDLRNDTELALLSKGEAVLPNSVTQSAHPAQKAAEFMQHLQDEREKKGGKKSAGYEKVASAKKSLKERIEHLEMMCMGGKVA